MSGHVTPGLQRLLQRLDDADLWESRAVGRHSWDKKQVDHPEVGRLTLDCDVMTVQGSDLKIVAYTAEPGSADADKLALLRVVGLQTI